MGRSKAKTYLQPDDNTCGPTSLKTALEILGQRQSLNHLINLCKPTRNGTYYGRVIAAANRLGLSVLAIEWANLKHIQSALKYKPGQPRAVIVNYLYDLKENGELDEDSGHFATVSSYSASRGRIVLFDPATGRKKSYPWLEFLKRWYEFDYKRRRHGKRSFRLVKKWSTQVMLILARDPKHLPKFKISTAKLFLP